MARVTDIILEGLVVGPDQYLVVRCSPFTTWDVMQRFRDEFAVQYPDLSPRVVVVACDALAAIDAGDIPVEATP